MTDPRPPIDEADLRAKLAKAGRRNRVLEDQLRILAVGLGERLGRATKMLLEADATIAAETGRADSAEARCRVLAEECAAWRRFRKSSIEAGVNGHDIGARCGMATAAVEAAVAATDASRTEQLSLHAETSP